MYIFKKQQKEMFKKEHFFLKYALKNIYIRYIIQLSNALAESEYSSFDKYYKRKFLKLMLIGFISEIFYLFNMSRFNQNVIMNRDF